MKWATPELPGENRAKPTFRIVGGDPVNSNEYPWFCSLEIVTSRGSFRCGGSLISNNYILTAAHCLYNTNINKVKVKLNTYNISSGTNDMIEGTVSSDKIYLNNQYNSRNLDNDIALLYMEYNNSDDSGKINPISLNNSDGELNLGEIDIIGYGLTTEGGGTSDILMKATVGIVNDSECNNSYPNVELNNKICVAGPGKDSCQGDSGGPLFKDGILYGITSFGQGCARPGFPGVYTDVYFYKQWINNTINDKNISDPIWECCNKTNPSTQSPTQDPSVPTSSPTQSPTQDPSVPTSPPTQSPTQDPSIPTSPPTQSPTKKPDKKDDKLSAGAIAGIVIGVSALIGILIFCLWKRKKGESKRGSKRGSKRVSIK